MTISIVDVREAKSNEWDSIWATTPYATYFHSRKWAKLFNVYSGGKMQSTPWLVAFSDGCTALVPLTSERLVHGFATRYYSSPAGTYGGWLSADRLTAEHAGLLSTLMLKRTGNLIWRLNPFDERASGTGADLLVDDDTHVLNLTKGFDHVFRYWSKGHKAAVRQAHRAGITVRQANSIQDFEAYYTVYQDSLRRWGNNATSRYEWSFFKEIFSNLSENEILWLAIHENTPVSGALCLYSTNIVNYWHGATLEKYFKMRPVNLLMYEAIKHACQETYSWFDFNPSGGHKGVRAFKHSFGTTSLYCPVVKVRDWRLSLTETLRRIVRR